MAGQTEQSTRTEAAVVEKSKKWIAVLGVLTAALTLTTAALGVVGARATQQKDRAEEQVSSLSEEISTITTEVDSIRSDRESLVAEVAELERQRDELRQELESVTPSDGPDGPPSDAAVPGLTYLSKEDRLARDRYGFGSEQVSGTVYPNSVFGYQTYCGSSSRESYADWNLGRRHEAFTATAGLSDNNHSATLTVRFEVFLDNEQVYQETIGVGEAVPVTIPVEGKLRIRLLTVFLTPEDCSGNDRAIWGDAALS